MEVNKIIVGDCLIKLKELEDNSVDSIVTDPPYHLVSASSMNSLGGSQYNKQREGASKNSRGFMGKTWDGLGEDGIGIAQNPELWKECLRVLKPGGHLLAFSGTRTYHRMAVAIEDAGFEVRDMIEWVYGSGFPKSLNIGKKVDELQGNEREEIVNERWAEKYPNGPGGNLNPDKYTQCKRIVGNPLMTSKGTSEWEGWGTALKPAHEPICMARKPIECKTVAENCLKYGTGGINIDESRVGTEKVTTLGGDENTQKFFNGGFKKVNIEHIGRFPANLITDGSEEVRECFPETGSVKGRQTQYSESDFAGDGGWKGEGIGQRTYDGSGNASRFFKSIIYQAKASKSDRNSNGSVKNIHPTCKPTKLMEYLIKMVTPKGGVVLDPFSGSFSTGVACIKNGFGFIGIEREEEYIKIGKARMEQAEKEKNKLDNQPKLL